MGSVAEDPQFPVEPAACAGCSPYSGAPCYIQLYVPFPHRPHPDTWRSGSSEETPLEWSQKRERKKTQFIRQWFVLLQLLSTVLLK